MVIPSECRRESGRVVETPHPSVLLGSLVFAVLVFSVTQGMIIPGIGHIADEFGTSVSTATWVLSGNLAVMAVCLPLLGRLGDMFGRRRVLLVSLGFLTVGGVIAALSPDFGWLVAGRVVQGVGGGTFSLAYGLARENLPPQRQANAVGILASAAGVGGAVGPTFGGATIDAWGYQGIFWVNAVMAAGALIGVAVVVPGIRRAVVDRVDLLGAGLLTVGVTLPLLVVSRTQDSGWSDVRTISLLALSIAVLVAFVPLERRRHPPLIDTRTLQLPQVALTNAATVLVGAANFAAMVLVPQLAQSDGTELGLDATQAGLLLLPGSLAMLVVGAVAGRIGGLIGNRLLLITGTSVATGGMVALTFAHGSATALTLGILVLFAGVGATWAAFANLIVATVPLAQTGEATGVNGLFRIVGSAVGAQVGVAIVSTASLGGAQITTAGFTAAFGTFTAVLLVALALAVVLPRPLQVP